MLLNRIRTSFLCATALVAVSPAMAQQAAAPQAAAVEDGSGEIVVTARQRNERLIDVPVAVTALGAADIARYGAKSLQDIAQMAPQVTIAKQASGSGSSFVIRGIGSSTLDTGFDQSVSINVDGIQTSRGRSLQQSYFDVGQVEILKGPQALFFGRNSPAGVISVSTANPTKDFTAGGTVGYEFRAREMQANGYVSGPLTDTLGIRVAAQGSRSRGWMQHVPGVAVAGSEPATGLASVPSDKWGPKERQFMGRVTLAWDPTDNFDANLKVTAGKSTDNGEGTNGEIVYCGTPGVVSENGKVDPYADCKKNYKVSSSELDPSIVKGVIAGGDGKSYSRYVPIIASLTANWTTDKVKLTSVTGFYQYKLRYFQSDFAKTIYNQYFGSQVEKYQQFTQEVRALTTFESPVNFMIGGYYGDTTLDNEQSLRIAPLPADSVTGNYSSLSKVGSVKSKTYSIFGQVTGKITDNLELAGGVRWTKEDKDVFQQNIYVHELLTGLFTLNPFNSKYSGKNWSPEATLTWHPTSRTTLYGAYKTGYKSGGFGLPALLTTGTTDADFTFGPEKVKGGEIGAKGEFLNGKLTINSAIYRYDYKGLQVDIFDGTKVTYQIFNAGSARSQGAELDARYSPSRDLSFRAAVGYNRTRYRDYLSACYGGQTFAAGCNLQFSAGAYTRQDLGGAPTVRAPDWSGSLGVTYDHDLTDALRFGVSTDVSGTSKYYFSETEGPGTLQKGFVKLNAAVRLYRSDDKWSVALIGKNLTDKYVVTGGSDRPGSGSGTGTTNGVNADILGYADRPREIMLQVGFKY